MLAEARHLCHDRERRAVDMEVVQVGEAVVDGPDLSSTGGRCEVYSGHVHGEVIDGVPAA